MPFLFPLDSHWRTGLGVSFLGTSESQDKKWVLLQMSWAWFPVETAKRRESQIGERAKGLLWGVPLRSPALGPAHLGRGLAVGYER